ncbi:MAG TPA: HEAT repeat domain-containing protein [Planctomycetota bacterium]|nr:HEAT repeat domain-containing protein [Planctomycetota bacterium]
MPLKIYFCDACNESIPLKDLHSNRITFDAGKIFCAKCGVKRPKDPARFPAATVAGLFVLTAALTGVLGYLGGQELRKVGAASDATRTEVVRLEQALNATRADAFSRAECERMLAPLVEGTERGRKDLGALEERLRLAESGLRTETAGVAKRVDEAAKASTAAETRLAEAEKAIRETAEGLRAAVLAQQELGRRLGELAARVTSLPAAPAEPVAAPADGPTATESAELARLTSLLRDSDGGKRYEAVNGLGALRLEAARSALEDALADVESYVRDAAVRALRRHASLKSVPRLIAALRDSDEFVRASARSALKQLVGAEPAFDHASDAAKREKAIRDYEAWWAANSEKFLNPK